MNYHFDSEVAKQYGVDEAIIIENLKFWILKNKANEKHFYEGTYWTYNSTRAFKELFPFWSEKQIDRILNSLKEKGIIKVGNYNQIAYDRTRWYAFTENVESILPNGEMETPKQENGIPEKVGPIPYNKPDSKTQLINTYTNNIDLINAINDFIDMRKKIRKVMTDRAIKLMLDKLNEIAKTDSEKIEILNQSTVNSWQGIFPLKEDKNGGNKRDNRKNEIEYDFSKFGG